MKIIGRTVPVHVVALVIIVLLVTARWYFLGCDFTVFFNAGSDYVTAGQTPGPVAIQEGQGYDGQFFYRLALDPFDFSSEKFGVKFDYQSYRTQRIIYPLLAYLFSFGGVPALVPFALVLVNVLSFFGLFYMIKKITAKINSNHQLAIYPIFIFGLYMSVAKDLSEVTAIFFFTATIWYMLNASWLWFSFFATLALLTRETTLIALFPLCLWLFFQIGSGKVSRMILLFIPFFILMAWKTYLQFTIERLQLIEGSGNVTWPFLGIIPGLLANWDFSSSKKIFQFIFWMGYMIWQTWFIIIVISCIRKYFGSQLELFKPMAVIYCCWLAFALCLSPAIYSDDWAFVRVFALWNLTGFLILISANTKAGNSFNYTSMGMLALTLIRLIIRP